MAEKELERKFQQLGVKESYENTRVKKEMTTKEKSDIIGKIWSNSRKREKLTFGIYLEILYLNEILNFDEFRLFLNACKI